VRRCFGRRATGFAWDGATFLFPASDLGACYPRTLSLSPSIVSGPQGDYADSQKADKPAHLRNPPGRNALVG
jgi:hypothetical protein